MLALKATGHSQPAKLKQCQGQLGSPEQLQKRLVELGERSMQVVLSMDELHSQNDKVSQLPGGNYLVTECSNVDVCMSVCPSVCLSACVSVHLCVCWSVLQCLQCRQVYLVAGTLQTVSLGAGMHWTFCVVS